MMEWNQILALMGVNIAMLAVLTTLIVWAIGKIDADVKSIGNDVKSCVSRLDSHATRIDQLYKMFLDSQKEFNQKFYDLLKEIKK